MKSYEGTERLVKRIVKENGLNRIKLIPILDEYGMKFSGHISGGLRFTRGKMKIDIFSENFISAWTA